MSVFVPGTLATFDEWEYFKFSPHLEIELLPQEGMENIFEVMVVVRPCHSLQHCYHISLELLRERHTPNLTSSTRRRVTAEMHTALVI